MTEENSVSLDERINIRGEIEGIHATLTEREKAHEQRFQAQEKSVSAALTAAKEAVDKAEKAQERRLDLLNEFRAQSSDEQKKFATKELVETNVSKLNRLETSIARVQVGAGLIGATLAAIIVKLVTG